MVTTRSGKPLLGGSKSSGLNKRIAKPAAAIVIFDDSTADGQNKKRESPCKLSKKDVKKSKLQDTLVDKENLLNSLPPPPVCPSEVKKIEISQDEKQMSGAPEGDLYEMVVFDDAELWPYSSSGEAREELVKCCKVHTETAVWAEKYESVVVMRRVLLHHTEVLLGDSSSLSQTVFAAVSDVDSLRSCRVRNGIMCLRSILAKCSDLLNVPIGTCSSSSSNPQSTTPATTTLSASIVNSLLAKTGGGPKFIAELAFNTLLVDGVGSMSPLALVTILLPSISHRNPELASSAIMALSGCARRMEASALSDPSEECMRPLSALIQGLAAALSAKRPKAKEEARNTLKMIHATVGESHFQELLSLHLSGSLIGEVSRAVFGSAAPTPSSVLHASCTPSPAPLRAFGSAAVSTLPASAQLSRVGGLMKGPPTSVQSHKPTATSGSAVSKFRMHMQAMGSADRSKKQDDVVVVAAPASRSTPAPSCRASALSAPSAVGSIGLGCIAMRDSSPEPVQLPMAEETNCDVRNEVVVCTVNSGNSICASTSAVATTQQVPPATPVLSLRDHIMLMKQQNRKPGNKGISSSSSSSCSSSSVIITGQKPLQPEVFVKERDGDTKESEGAGAECGAVAGAEEGLQMEVTNTPCVSNTKHLCEWQWRSFLLASIVQMCDTNNQTQVKFVELLNILESVMSRTGPKRGRDSVYEVVKGQYCDPTDEERLSLKTPQTSCIHCHAGQTRNTSEMHWHLCVCVPFGNKEPVQQAMLRTCVPDSILRSHKKKALYLSWQANSGSNGAIDDMRDEPIKLSSGTKKTKFVDNRNLCEDLNKLIAKWAFMYQVPSSAIECQEFRDIIFSLNPDVYKLPDKASLSGSLIDALCQQTQMRVSEHFSKSEGLQLRLPVEDADPLNTSDDPTNCRSTLSGSVQIYDGRGSFFYRPVVSASRRSNTYPQRLLDTASSVAELKNNAVVSLLLQPNQDYSEEQNGQAGALVQAFDSAFGEKIFVSTEPFSPMRCADMMLSNIAAVHQAVTHAQCILQYLQPSSGPAGTIVRNIVASSGSEYSMFGTAFFDGLKLPVDNSVESVNGMLSAISSMQEAGLFNRLLNDGMYQNYCRALPDNSSAQASISVQSILVSGAAMSGIQQASVALQLLLTAASKSSRHHCATYSDAFALREALVGAVNKTNNLSIPWRTMLIQVIAAQWDRSYHMLVALACKVDPRRRFADLPGNMEADAQLMRDKLVAQLEPSERKAVIDSWVLMLKRDGCFSDDVSGGQYSLESVNMQSPIDWWIAHAAAHRELRISVVFPALSALGISLEGNRTPTRYDPAHRSNTLEEDVAQTVEKAELSKDVLLNRDFVEKISYIRRNCWALHHARREGRASVKKQFDLLSPADLLPTEFSQHQSAHTHPSAGSSSSRSTTASTAATVATVGVAALSSRTTANTTVATASTATDGGVGLRLDADAYSVSDHHDYEFSDHHHNSSNNTSGASHVLPAAHVFAHLPVSSSYNGDSGNEQHQQNQQQPQQQQPHQQHQHQQQQQQLEHEQHHHRQQQPQQQRAELLDDDSSGDGF